MIGPPLKCIDADALLESGQDCSCLVPAAGESEANHADAGVSAAGERRGLDCKKPLDIRRHQHRLLETRGNVWIEPARLRVCRDRLLVEPAIPARVHEPGEQFRVIAMPARFAKQPHDGLLGVPHVGLEIGVELVRDRKPRVQRERAAERFLGTLFAVERAANVFADDAMTPADVRPRRSKAGIELDTALVQFPGLRKPIIIAP